MVINFLGMAEWVVDDVETSGPDLRVHAHVAERPKVCPRCGTVGPRLESKGVRKRLLMDVPRGSQRVGIEATARRYLCLECNQRFWEPLPGADEKRRATKRLVEHMVTQAFDRTNTFTSVADEVGVSEATVRDVFQEAAAERERTRVIDPGPRILGVDEVHLSQKRRFVVVNLGLERATLIDMLPTRKKEVVRRYFEEAEWREGVEVIAMDMWRPYRDMAEEVWPERTVVIDKFHVVQEATRVVEAVRQNLMVSGDAKSRDRLGVGFGILRRRERDLNPKQREWLERCRRDWAPVLGRAFDVKERLYRVYNANDRAEGEERMEAWEQSVPKELREAFKTVRRRLRKWRKEILAYFDVGVTNAGTEAINGLIKVTRQLSPALAFESLRWKMLFGSAQNRGGFWSGGSTGEMLEHGMGFSTGGETVGVSQGTAGTDLLRLVGEMHYRVGIWDDPGLWVE